MALNKFMHPRNIYRTPPDFVELAKTFPEFSKISKVDVTSKISIDFKDPKALRILTKCLLKRDFELDVLIPEDRLVPTLPLRLNYVLWLEDLLTLTKITDVNGIDIGTGACAIYPLLAASKMKWNMVGTEMDSKSYKKAEENISRNNLQDLIKLFHTESQTIIEELLTKDDKAYDFCMCNPPFYGSFEELCESRSTARPAPKNAFTGTPHELITEGGELEFIRKLINESKKFKKRICFFTTMVGHKFNLKELTNELKAEGVSHTYTEFCQGRVTRWGLAWTYEDMNLLEKLPPRDKLRKKSSPISIHLQHLEGQCSKINAITHKICSILDVIQISHYLINKRGNTTIINIKATENTWSNQRRKRRNMKQHEESKRRKTDDSSQQPTENDYSNTSTNDTNEKVNGIEITTRPEDTFSKINNNNVPLVCANVKIKVIEKSTLLEFEMLDGVGGKDSLHQIAQYIKNNWK